MRSGRLRHRVTIERDHGRSLGAADALGQAVPRWQALASHVPAGIEFRGGNTQDQAEQRQALATHQIALRMVRDLRPGDRIAHRHGDTITYYYVDAVGDPKGKGRELIAYCRSQV